MAKLSMVKMVNPKFDHEIRQSNVHFDPDRIGKNFGVSIEPSFCRRYGN